MQLAQPPEIAPPVAPVPVPAPVLVTCCFCAHRGVLQAEVEQYGTRFECTNRAACWQRAQASGLYARTESELELSQFEARQGALR